MMRHVWEVVRGTVRSAIEDDCMGAAAQIAYHWIFSLFPGLFVLAATLSLLGSNEDLVGTVYEALRQVAPRGTAQLVKDTLDAMGQAGGLGTAQVLTLGLLSMSWVASNGFAVIMGNLNRAYDLKETRSFLRRRLMAIALVFAVGFGLLVAFNLLVAGTGWVTSFVEALPVATVWPGLLRWSRWPLYFVLALSVAAILYAVAPALPRIDWRWTLPGAAVFAVLWLTAGYFFDAYLARSNTANEAYWAIIGTFLALLGWLYITAFAFLIGGEVNGRIRCLRLEAMRRQQAETAQAAASAAIAADDDESMVGQGGL